MENTGRSLRDIRDMMTRFTMNIIAVPEEERDLG